ncbi:hypothetical protein HG530_014191 [Fusarium avenaceum]|nr:hypothetical protein HG530_014191 [Fusarium avenaceum]
MLVSEVTLHLLAGKKGQPLFDTGHILLELLSENRPVSSDTVLNIVFGFISREHKVLYVQLLANILLQRLNIFKILGIRVENHECLERLLETNRTTLARHTSQLNDALHATNTSLYFLIKQLLADVGEWQKVHTSGVLSLKLFGDIWQQLQENTSDLPFHFLVDECQQTLGRSKDPTVHDVGVAGLKLGVPSEVHVLNLLQKSNLTLEELVAVPQWQKDLLNNLLDARFLESQWLSSHNRRVNEVKSESIRSVLRHDDGRIGVVLEPLGHLFAILCKYYTVDHTILEWGLAKKMSAQHCQSVEPSASLIQSFGDEISREGLVELFDVLKGVVLASIGHASRLKPAVEYLLNTFQLTLALFAGNSNVINLVTVKIRKIALVTTQVTELLNTSYANSLLQIFTDPQRNRSGLLNVLEHIGNNVRNADEPRGDSPVDEGRIRARTHRVRMLELGFIGDAAGILEVLYDVLVGFLDVHALKIGNSVGEVTGIVDRIRRRSVLGNDACGDGNVVIILTKSWCLVHNAHATVIGNVGGI